MRRRRRPGLPLWRRICHGRRYYVPAPWSRCAATVLLGIVLGLSGIAWIEASVRPAIAEIARAEAQNVVTEVLDRALTDCMAGTSGLSYSSLVEIQRDEAGQITAMVTDVAAMNELRTRVVEDALTALEALDVHEIQVPLGSIIDFQLFWGRGPSMSARSMTVGTVHAEFTSEFVQAGINQTKHRIVLNISVPLTLIMAGGTITTEVEAGLPVAETVLVGQVPETYLDLGG